MKKRIIVELKERPSFEGELNIRVTAEPDSPGKVKYALVCQKNPPLNDEMVDDGGISDRELEQIWAAIWLGWNRSISLPGGRRHHSTRADLSKREPRHNLRAGLPFHCRYVN
jgi:hypothetical protein